MIKVGNIVYLLDKKTHAIVPCMIVEQVNSISLEGETTHHIMKTPAGRKAKLEDFKSPWFQDIPSARDFLMEAAKNLVDETVEKANQIAAEAFGDNLSALEESNVNENDFVFYKSEEDSPVETSSNEVFVDLPNGQKARVSMPDLG